MVILLGGTGCTGKTMLANRLMRKTNIPYFPLDHLMMGIYRGMPDCGFTPLDDQFDLGEKMWPVIKGLIMTNIENDHSLILEGFQLLPHLVRDFPAAYLDQTLPVFLLFSEDYIRGNFDEGIMKNRSAVERRGDIDDITAEKMVIDTVRLREQCIKHEVTFFEIKNDFEAEMMGVEKYILSKLAIV